MLQQSVPFARRTGQPAVNGLGEEITFPLAARWTREQNSDPVWRELARLNVAAFPSRMEWKGKTLNPGELRKVAEISGPRIRQVLEATMANPNYARLPDTTTDRRISRQDVLDRHIQRIRNAAKAQVMGSRLRE